MKNTFLLILFSVLFIASSTISCKKTSCYDEDFYQKHKNDVCTKDCPGVVGCDDEIYCNECIANRHGIRVK